MKIVILIASLFQLIGFLFAKTEVKEGTEMCKTFNVKLYSSLEKTPQSFHVNVKDIKLASLKEREIKYIERQFVAPNELGLYLEKTPNSQNINANHLKYLRNEQKKVWIPYSYCTEWKAHFNSNGTSTITNQLKRTSSSKTDTPMITIEFEYEKDWEIITEPELNQIVSWLNENTIKRRNIKVLLKTFMIQSASNYTMSKKHIEEVRVNRTQTQQAIQNLNTQITQINVTITQYNVQIKQLYEQLSRANADVAYSEKLQQDITNEISLLSKQIARERIIQSQIKIPSVTSLQLESDQLRKLIALPQQAPASFLKEYTLASTDTVAKAYQNCNGMENTVDQCELNLKNYNAEKKGKLRRFF